ncbi:chaperone modulatory protein CbpM [Pseudoxanthomonas sp. 3HH-4]|uniref:chaperone modulator CbpM n=1 Tax=Pseudoxanthomonas sp. 3HH-4 TaxID=1690214 RepID=UPI0011738B9B|nr:chaperone modulator CbpM [Pseudoxanthomonas sp. 3HH-4]TQM12291.1 chaperone modulatory protein CbpM [Pseudoxanthomonas sp. 3HH-4]
MSIDIEVFLSNSGIKREVLEQWIENEWVTPSRTGVGVHLTSVDVARVYFVRDLSADFGVNDAGIEVALHLVDQIHALRRVLRSLQHELGPEGTSNEDYIGQG